MNTPRDNKIDAVRPMKIDRALLVGILIIQLGMIVWLFYQHQMQNRDDSTSPRTPDPNTLVSHDAQQHATASRRGYPSHFPLPQQQRSIPAHPEMLKRSTIRQELDRMMQDTMSMVDRMNDLVHFDDQWNRLYASPTMDMKELADSYEVVMSMPGISESDVEVKLDGRILTVIGKVRTQQEGQSSYRQFKTQIQLPGPVDASQIAKTNLENGILRISIPKNTQTSLGQDNKLIS